MSRLWLSLSMNTRMMFGLTQSFLMRRCSRCRSRPPYPPTLEELLSRTTMVSCHWNAWAFSPVSTSRRMRVSEVRCDPARRYLGPWSSWDFPQLLSC